MYWRKIEISRTVHMKREVLHRVKEERNILYTIKRRKANWVGQIMRRNCLLKHVIEGVIKGTGRQGRRREQLWTALRKREDTGI
jgi:hypothetical protein